MKLTFWALYFKKFYFPVIQPLFDLLIFIHSTYHFNRKGFKVFRILYSLKLKTMIFRKQFKTVVLFVLVQIFVLVLVAQPGVPFTKWTTDGSSYYQVEKGEIIRIDLPSQKKTTLISKDQLKQIAEPLVKSGYGSYLLQLIK